MNRFENQNMANVLIGYPLTREEVIRVCGLERFHEWTGTGRRPSELGIRYTDKCQYVLGVECEMGCASNPGILDDAISLLQDLAHSVRRQIAAHGLDVSSLKIYPMECEEREEINPEIRVIIWTG